MGFWLLDVSPFPNAQNHSVMVPEVAMDKSVNCARCGEHPVWSLTVKSAMGDGFTRIKADFVSVSEPELSLMVSETV